MVLELLTREQKKINASNMLREFEKKEKKGIKNKTDFYKELAIKYGYKDHTVVYQTIRNMKKEKLQPIKS